MSALRLQSVNVTDGTLEYEYAASGRLRRFFSAEPFFASYEVDVENLPESILTIPWLANVCPVAWAEGADVVVPTLDSEFRTALYRVQTGMKELYPALMEGGAVLGEQVVETETNADFEERAVLFTGGVDSLTTYIRHREEDPLLISMAGADVAHDDQEAWRRNREIVESFARERGLESTFVGTDMHGFLDGQQLRAHYQHHLDSTWWASVQHGLGLLGLCAPLAYANGISDLSIAATHTAAFDEPWGSHPAIDDEVSWAGTTAHHDGYDLSRQEKLGVIANYVDQHAPDLTIRACHEASDGGNCNRCEKCARTITGLLLSGLDPTRHGYDVRQGAFEEFRARFESGEWRLGEDERFMWADLQSHVDLDRTFAHPEVQPFLVWLSATDLDELVSRGSEPIYKQHLRYAASKLPSPVFQSLVPVYARLRRILG